MKCKNDFIPSLEPCPICKQIGCQTCRASIVRFFTLLESVSKRSEASTQIEQPTIKVGAAIDKLILDLPERPLLSSLNGTFSSPKRLKEPSLFVEELESGFLFRLSKDKISTNQIVTNPSKLPSYSVYLGHIQRIIPADQRNSVKILRVDLAIDYQSSFTDLISGLDILGPKVNTAYTDRSGLTEGFTIGKGQSKFSIYNKEARHDLDEPWTRIERQLKGKYLPCKNLNDLTASIMSEKFNPFKNISLNSIQYLETNIATPNDQKKISELKTLIGQNGFYTTRRRLNQNDNFKRDYGHLFKMQEIYPSPYIAFKNEIKKYFIKPVP